MGNTSKSAIPKTKKIGEIYTDGSKRKLHLLLEYIPIPQLSDIIEEYENTTIDPKNPITRINNYILSVRNKVINYYNGEHTKKINPDQIRNFPYDITEFYQETSVHDTYRSKGETYILCKNKHNLYIMCQITNYSLRCELTEEAPVNVYVYTTYEQLYRAINKIKSASAIPFYIH
jgi:hypothetical protein